jgi:hypothetical protein
MRGVDGSWYGISQDIDGAPRCLVFVEGCVPICFNRLEFLSLPPRAALKYSFIYTDYRVIHSVLSIIRENGAERGCADV